MIKKQEKCLKNMCGYFFYIYFPAFLAGELIVYK